jgi:anthranilate synthase component 1
MITEFEPRVPRIGQDDLGAPDMVFMVTDGLIIFDRVKHRLITLVHAHVEEDPEKAYERAIEELDSLQVALQTPVQSVSVSVPDQVESLEPRSNTTREEFFDMVDRAKEYIRSGDVIQTVLSQRFEVDNEADSLDVYRALRAVNPSPYMFCLDMGESAIVGTSPEIHVRCQDRRVEVRPIAGTRPRGGDDGRRCST